MIWNILVIAGVVIVFIIVARRLPVAIKLNKEKKEISPEKITTIGTLAQADDAFERKEFEKAEQLYIKAASQEPNNAKIYNRLGAIYLEQSNFYDAKEAFLQAAKLEPDIASRYINLGLAYMGLKDYFKALQAFEEGLKLDPKNKKYRSFFERAARLHEREKKRQKK